MNKPTVSRPTASRPGDNATTDVPRLLSLSIFTVPVPATDPPTAELRTISTDVSSFSWLQRSTITDFLRLTSSIVAARTADNARECVVKEGNNLFVRRRGKTVVVAVTNLAYPSSAALGLLETILRDVDENANKFPVLDTMLAECQDPAQATPIGKIQQELDETKAVLTKTIDQVLQRGEKLDTLVERSNELSTTSKMFYKTAKKQNSCCTVM